MNNRRDFLKTITVGATFVLGSSLLFKEYGFAQAPAAPKKLTKKDLILESDGQAVTLNYCVNADKDIKSKKPKCPARKEAAKKGQYCGSPCNFYAEAGKVDGVAVGKCQLFPGEKYVSSKGWCNSWAAKQG